MGIPKCNWKLNKSMKLNWSSALAMCYIYTKFGASFDQIEKAFKIYYSRGS